MNYGTSSTPLKKSNLCRGLIFTFVVSVACGAQANTISLNPTDTYLLTNGEVAGMTTPILLADYGISAGDTIIFTVLGEWDCGNPCGDTITNTIGVFSASDVLLGPGVLNRVADAIDAGDDEETPAAFFGSVPTDIPEDFLVTSDLQIVVPTGAEYLFVAARDNLYSDNTDPNDNYGITLQAIPIPAAGWLFLSAICWFGLRTPLATLKRIYIR